MFTNCNCCMNNCYMQDPTAYLEIKNLTPFTIFFILQYTLNKSTVTKKSLKFGYAHIQRLRFEMNAHNICFNILRHITPEPTFLYNGVLPHAVTTCFEFSIPPTGPQCVQIHC